MTRAQFLHRLREGLAGLPKAEIADIVADYDSHFADAAAAGRNEEEVAESLGDPARLAKELRTEASIKRWEEKNSIGNFFAACWAVLGILALNIFVLLPILFVAFLLVGIFLFVLFILATVGFGLLSAIFGGIGGFAVGMVGLAMLSMVLGCVALLLLFVIWALKLLINGVRGSYRLIDRPTA